MVLIALIRTLCLFDLLAIDLDFWVINFSLACHKSVGKLIFRSKTVHNIYRVLFRNAFTKI